MKKISVVAENVSLLLMQYSYLLKWSEQLTFELFSDGFCKFDRRRFTVQRICGKTSFWDLIFPLFYFFSARRFLQLIIFKPLLRTRFHLLFH